MLAYFLATIMAIISLTLYLNAFISPKIHRQDDFLWSGLGLFYSLTLWICAGRITGAVLLGQFAVTFIAIAFIWENRQLRKVITANADSNQVLEGFSVLSLMLTSLSKLSELTKKKPPIINKTKINNQDNNNLKEKTETVTQKIPTPQPQEIVSPEVTTESVSIPAVAQEIILSENDTKDEAKEADKVINNIATHEEEKQEVIKSSLDSPEISSPSMEEKPSVINIVDVEETNLDDDFDIDSLGLSSSSENKPLPPKSSIFGKIFAALGKPFQRKATPPPKSPDLIVNQEVDDNEESVIHTDIVEIDPKTTATEVEEAIANCDIVDSNNISEEEETINPETETETEMDIVTQSQEETINPETETDIDIVTQNQEETINPETETETEMHIVTQNQEETINNQEEKIEEELLSEKSSDVDDINSQDIPEEDIIDTLSDLFPVTKTTNQES
ncbi:Ycf66 family protein [Geminocystis sp.]|uniref:Ycf66 family protein n=1 Tax=Geminocystis sp. TaxID=2664100 RepID=UPI0035939B1E